MMIRRETLALLNHCYRFVHDHRDAAAPLPYGVLRELADIKALLPMFRANTACVWHSSVHASDASSVGLGVCAAKFGQGIVAAIP